MSTKKNRSTDAIFREMLGHVSFGEMLESERISLGLTQTVFAKKLGISKQELCDIEKGRKSVSLDRVKNFALKLGDSPYIFAQYLIQDLLYRAGIDAKVRLSPLKKAA